MSLILCQEASNDYLRTILTERVPKRAKNGLHVSATTKEVVAEGGVPYNLKTSIVDVCTEFSSTNNSELLTMMHRNVPVMRSPVDPPVLLAGQIPVPRCFLEHERWAGKEIIRPPVDKVFPTTTDINNIGRLCDTAELTFRCFFEISKVDLCERARKACGTTLSFNWSQYRRANLESILCLLINGAGCGFATKKSRLDNSMEGYRRTHARDSSKMQHYQCMMQNLLVYMFRYGLDPSEHGYFLSQLPSKTVETAANTCYRRLNFELWSCEYVDQGTGPMLPGELMMCKGHNYYYGLVYDRILFKGIEKEVKKRHRRPSRFLTVLQKEVMFGPNDGQRFWMREDLEEMVRRL